MSLNLSKTFGLIRPMTRSLLLSTSTLTRFAVNGVEAALALDFIGGEYRTANTSTTFADAFTGTSPKLTYSTAAGSNSTMVNSEGKIVWAPHNLALNSATPATQTIAVTSGADYTVEVTGAGSMALSGAGTGTATDGSPATITASTTSLTITLTGSLDTVAVYRSDLGGMHPVPGAVGDFQYYVPTNGNAEYLPRVGHHVYNGSAWVNEGLLIESEQRVNLITNSTPQSGDLDLSGGSFSYVTCNFTPLSGPGIHFDDTTVTSYTYFTPTYTAADYTFSVFVEMDDGNAPSFTSSTNNNVGNDFAFAVDQDVLNPLDHTVEHYGGNTYRVSCTATSSSTTTRNTGVVKYNTNSSRTFKVTGFQLEQGSTPSSYIPTSGSTVTRGAQSLTVPAHWYDADNPTYTGPELGPDLSSYATQADAVTDGWSVIESVWSFNAAGNKFVHDGTANGNIRYDVPEAEAGKVFEATFTVGGGGAVGFYIGTGFEVGSYQLSNGVGTHTITLPAGTQGGYVQWRRTSGAPEISNISVRQVSAPQFGWPEPEYIGPELVDNGDFSLGDNGDWTKQAGWSISGGVASYAPSTGRELQQTISTTTGGVYLVSFEITDLTTGGFGVYSVESNVTVVSYENSVGVYTVALTATGSSMTVRLRSSNTSTEGSIDNISVREINPLSVSIQMDGRMTYANTAAFPDVEFSRWGGAVRDTLRSYITANASGSGMVVSYQDEGGTFDTVLSDANAYTPGINVPFNISSRHGTTFVNGAVDGVALTADTTPTALPDLSGADLQIAYDFMGTIGTFRQFAGDVGDTGLEEATS